MPEQAFKEKETKTGPNPIADKKFDVPIKEGPKK